MFLTGRERRYDVGSRKACSCMVLWVNSQPFLPGPQKEVGCSQPPWSFVLVVKSTSPAGRSHQSCPDRASVRHMGTLAPLNQVPAVGWWDRSALVWFVGPFNQLFRSDYHTGQPLLEPGRADICWAVRGRRCGSAKGGCYSRGCLWLLWGKKRTVSWWMLWRTACDHALFQLVWDLASCFSLCQFLLQTAPSSFHG